MTLQPRPCEKPGCSDDGSETYKGPHGNTLKVCPRHYYQLVTKNTVPKFDSGTAIELSPRTLPPRKRFQEIRETYLDFDGEQDCDAERFDDDQEHPLENKRIGTGDIP